MAGYAAQGVDHRIGTLAGRPAEQAFLAVLAAEGKALGERVFRLGLDQLPTGNAVVPTLTPFVRYAPDFVQVGGYAWEVQGCGENGLVTFKLEKLLTQAAWHEQLALESRDLRYAFFAQGSNLLYRVTFQHVLWAILHRGTFFPAVVDAKPGWTVPVTAFEAGEVVSLGDALRALKGK